MLKVEKKKNLDPIFDDPSVRAFIASWHAQGGINKHGSPDETIAYTIDDTIDVCPCSLLTYTFQAMVKMKRESKEMKQMFEQLHRMT